MALTERVSEDWDNWTLSQFAKEGGGTRIAMYSGETLDLKTGTAKRSFVLANPANAGTLTVESQDYDNRVYLHPGYSKQQVVLEKPDSSEVILYTAENGNGSWYYTLNGEDIKAHLDAAGTYWLWLKGWARSSVDDLDAPSWYGWSQVKFRDISLRADTDVPAQVQNLVLTRISTTQIDCAWDVVSGADSYKLYYRVQGAGSWTEVEGIAGNSYQLLSLTVCTTYEVKVAAVNASGEGTSSGTQTERTRCTYTKDFTEVLGLTETFVKGRSLDFLDPLNLQEHFDVLHGEGYSSEQEKLLAMKNDTKVYSFETGQPTGTFDTDDIDFGRAGQDTTLSKVEFESEAESPHTVNIYVSVDSGLTWTYVGQGTAQRGKLSRVFCWITAEKHRVRFTGPGLYLQHFALYAVPRGPEPKE